MTDAMRALLFASLASIGCGSCAIVGCGAKAGDVGTAPGVDSGVKDSKPPSDAGDVGDGATTDTPSACKTGDPCFPFGDPCHTGTLDCSTSGGRCVVSGNLANGSKCGTNRICRDGACIDCTVGVHCVPTNACHDGSISCTGGAPSCDDKGTNVSNGTTCGSGLVCKDGSCRACASGSTCTPTTACKTGAIDCSSGDPVCKESGNVADGTGCGASKSCRSGACTCDAGTTACGSACVVTTSDASNCGSCGNVCESGICRGGGCETFFGVYEMGGTTCTNASPFTSGCSCPGSTSSSTASQALFAEPPSPRNFYQCIPSTHTRGSDFGGVWATGDVGTPCAAIPSDGCMAKNPFTGACTCPGSTSAVQLRTIIRCPSDGGMIGGHLGFCMDTSAKMVSFGGVYESDDPVSGGVGCRVTNPATGGCSCPAGTSANGYRVWVDSSAGIIGSTIFVCSAP